MRGTAAAEYRRLRWEPFARVSSDAQHDLALGVEIDAQLAAGGLRDALSGAVGDPSLELAFWLPHRGKCVDIDGRR